MWFNAWQETATLFKTWWFIIRISAAIEIGYSGTTVKRMWDRSSGVIGSLPDSCACAVRSTSLFTPNCFWGEVCACSVVRQRLDHASTRCPTSADGYFRNAVFRPQAQILRLVVLQPQMMISHTISPVNAFCHVGCHSRGWNWPKL